MSETKCCGNPYACTDGEGCAVEMSKARSPNPRSYCEPRPSPSKSKDEMSNPFHFPDCELNDGAKQCTCSLRSRFHTEMEAIEKRVLERKGKQMNDPCDFYDELREGATVNRVKENTIKVSGIGRFVDEEDPHNAMKALLVSFNAVPTDEEFRAFSEYIKQFTFIRKGDS